MYVQAAYLVSFLESPRVDEAAEGRQPLALDATGPSTHCTGHASLLVEMHLPRHDEVIAAVCRPPHLEQVVQRALLILQKSHLATATTYHRAAELDVLAGPLEDSIMYISCIERMDLTLF
jgi:hypothetical protein